MSRPPASGRSRPALLVGTALAVTLLLGAWMRWAPAGRMALPGDFAHLRHAHSHLGYYGILFPLAWLAWRRVGAPSPGGALVGVYAAATGIAFLGFVRAGYGPTAIVGSSVVGLVWLARSPRAGAWWVYHGCTALLAVPPWWPRGWASRQGPWTPRPWEARGS